MSRLSRRGFLGAGAALAMGLRASRALALDAGSEVSIGFIGLGGRGKGVLAQFLKQPGVKVGALCDADAAHLGAFTKDHPGAFATQDLRRVVERPDLDAVVICTPNHWHCLAAIWAIQNGKDVYVEKPLGHNVWEGRQLVKAAARHNRVVQIGTQQRSDPLQAEAKEFLHVEQPLGKPLYVQACRYGIRDSIGKRETPLTLPDSLDYNLWLGPARDQPIFRNRLHYDWHWDYNLGSGEMGNWGPHIIDDVRNVALQDKVALPSRVFSCGGRVVWDDAGESPNVQFAFYDTPVLPVFLGLSNLPEKPAQEKPQSLRCRGVESGYIVQCEGGYYAGWRGGGRAVDSDGKEVRGFSGDSGAGHAANFLAAVRASDASLLNAPVETGHHSTNWCHLANIAHRCGGPTDPGRVEQVADHHPAWESLVKTMHDHLASYDISLSDAKLSESPMLSLDPAAERFTGESAADANALLKREYREGFEMPEIA